MVLYISNLWELSGLILRNTRIKQMKIQQMWHTSNQLLVLFTKCVCNRSVIRYRCFKLPRKNIVMGHQWGCCHLSLDKSLTVLHYRPGVKTVACNAAPACPCSPVCLQFLSGNTWIWVDLVCSHHPSDKNNPCSYNHYFFSPLLHTHTHEHSLAQFFCLRMGVTGLCFDKAHSTAACGPMRAKTLFSVWVMIDSMLDYSSKH